MHTFLVLPLRLCIDLSFTFLAAFSLIRCLPNPAPPVSWPLQRWVGQQDSDPIGHIREVGNGADRTAGPKKSSNVTTPPPLTTMGVSKNRETPQNGWWKWWKNPIKMGWFGGKTHYFRKHPHWDKNAEQKRDMSSCAMTCVPNQWGPPDWCRSPNGNQYRSTALRWLVPKQR